MESGAGADFPECLAELKRRAAAVAHINEKIEDPKEFLCQSKR